MLVAFWAPVHGQPRTTSNMMAIATSLAMDYSTLRILMTHTHLEKSTLETGYLSLRTEESLNQQDVGMAGIEKLVLSGRLTQDLIKDFTAKIIKDRLDLLQGSGAEDREDFQKSLPLILDTAKRVYPLVMVDVSSGSRNEITNMVLKDADLIVVSLPQNLSVTDPFFRGKEYPEELEGKSILFCVGAYDHRSKMTIDKISSRYKISKARIGVVPYSYKFMDSQNNNNVVDYLSRYQNVKKRFLEFDEDAYFMESVRRMGKMILTKVGLHAEEDDELYGN